MIRLILLFIFFYKASSSEIRNFEAIVEEISEKSVEYKLRVSFPSKLYKEMLKPSSRKGELYIYNNNNKIIYYPSISYILKEDVKDDIFLKVLNDIKEFFQIKTKKERVRKRNTVLQFKDSRLYLIKYPNNTKIILKDYKLCDNIYFPQKIEILDKNIRIFLNIKKINFNLNFNDKDFELNEQNGNS